MRTSDRWIIGNCVKNDCVRLQRGSHVESTSNAFRCIASSIFVSTRFLSIVRYWAASRYLTPKCVYHVFSWKSLSEYSMISIISELQWPHALMECTLSSSHQKRVININCATNQRHGKKRRTTHRREKISQQRLTNNTNRHKYRAKHFNLTSKWFLLLFLKCISQP